MNRVNIEHDESRQRFSAEVEGHRGVLDYRLSDRIMAITHTAVPAPIARRGIAGDLMAAALRAARSAGWTVQPICSYAVAYMRRHPDGTERQPEELLDESLEESFPAHQPAVGGPQ